MLGFHLVLVTITWAVYNYTEHPNLCVLLFGVMPYNNVLLVSSIFTNESSIGCSDIIEHKELCMVTYYIPIKYILNSIISCL